MLIMMFFISFLKDAVSQCQECTVSTEKGLLFCLEETYCSTENKLMEIDSRLMTCFVPRGYTFGYSS